VYLSVTGKTKTVMNCLQWGQANSCRILMKSIILRDPSYVLSYLKDIEDIKKWGIEVRIKNTTTENYIDFGNYYPLLPDALLHLPQKELVSRINLTAVGNLVILKSITNKNYVLRGLMP
jgi:hypothetical protein